MNPVRIAAFLIATILSGALCAPFDRATGDPMPSAESPAAGGNAATKPRGRVYLFRGFAGVFFSRGTDRLAERVEQAGFPATVNEAMMCSGVAEEAISDYRRDPAPIVLIGHSVGGACAVNFAGRLKTENIPVSLLVTTDPARITADVPLNVERFINIFQSNSLLGGVEIAPAQGFHGHYASYDLTEHAEITHVNMEKTETVQEQLVTKISTTIGAAEIRRRGGAAPLCRAGGRRNRAVGQRHAGGCSRGQYVGNTGGAAPRTAVVNRADQSGAGGCAADRRSARRRPAPSQSAGCAQRRHCLRSGAAQTLILEAF